MDSENTQVCTEPDKWMQDTWVHSTRWVVELSNGETVWQDDGRPGLSEDSAWIRLKNYCEMNGYCIKSMRVEFRNNKPEQVYTGGEAYFFSKLIRGAFSSAKKVEVFNSHYYLIGMLKEGKVHIDKWLTPSLVVQDKYIRDAEKCKDNLIQGYVDG